MAPTPISFSSFTLVLLKSAHQSISRSARRKTLKEWDHEWGALSTEGNIWWMGSRSKEWFSVMGPNALGWICECFAIILCLFSCLPPPHSSLILLISASSGSRERTLDGRRPADYFASQSALVRAPMRLRLICLFLVTVMSMVGRLSECVGRLGATVICWHLFSWFSPLGRGASAAVCHPVSMTALTSFFWGEDR